MSSKVIYDSTTKEGSVDNTRPGDIVEYFDKGFRAGTVQKVWGESGRKKVKTEPIFYNKKPKFRF